MSKKIKDEVLNSTLKKMKKLKAPMRKKEKQYTKKEALQKLTPVMILLRKKGFEYSQIVEAIIASSKGEIAPLVNDVIKVLQDADTPPDVSSSGMKTPE